VIIVQGSKEIPRQWNLVCWSEQGESTIEDRFCNVICD
jgi:hypothetical protein